MRIEFKQFTYPATTSVFHCTIHLLFKNSSSLSPVIEDSEWTGPTERTRTIVGEDMADTALAEVMSTAVSLVGLSGHMETEGTLKFLDRF